MQSIARRLGLVSAVLFCSSMASAEPALTPKQFGAPIVTQAIVTQPPKQGRALASLSQAKLTSQSSLTSNVVLMNIPLTKDQMRILQTFDTLPSSAMNTIQDNPDAVGLPSRAILGMNNVPVFDQGMHGTCVTFAVTAALDALINKGDYVSQLCSLELGQYLESHSYLPSGWDGSAGNYVLSRFNEFGIVSTAKQNASSCAGITAYPAGDMNNTGNPMPIDDYIKLSEDANYDFYWYSLLMPEVRFSQEWVRTRQDEKLLYNIKTILSVKDAQQSVRLTIGALLPIEHCSAGACAKYRQDDDTWAISQSIRNDTHLAFGGHEMVITGYDDDAMVVDRDGGRHRGLLILRNSWGSQHGDGGDYYMTYDFFRHFVISVEVVGKA